MVALVLSPARLSRSPKMADLNKFVIQPSSKAVIYWVLVVFGSFIQQYFPPPQSYFSKKTNVFNVYMVKFSWGWTVGVLFLYLVASHRPSRPLARGLARLIVATFSWYFWTTLFVSIEDLTAVCEGGRSFATRSTCKAQGFYWNGFDISGHTFLLIHCCLVMTEEIQPLKDKKPRGRVLLLAWCLVGLQFLWEFMLVCTALYFHTVYDKIVAAAIAIAIWGLTYQWWYQCETKLTPGKPGQFKLRL